MVSSKLQKNPSPIIGLMAMDPIGTIGCNNALPWHDEGELQHFQETTKNAMLIMGRKTFDAFPKKLLQTRSAVVLSCCTIDVTPNIHHAKNLESCLRIVRHQKRPVFMIGGAMTAHTFLREKQLDAFILTRFYLPYQGDCFLKKDAFQGWKWTCLRQEETYKIFLGRPPLRSYSSFANGVFPLGFYGY